MMLHTVETLTFKSISSVEDSKVSILFTGIWSNPDYRMTLEVTKVNILKQKQQQQTTGRKFFILNTKIEYIFHKISFLIII